MRTSVFVSVILFTNLLAAQTPQATVETFFKAVSEGDEKELRKVVDERGASRMGKSILAAAPMFRSKGRVDFLELIFNRVPSEDELSKMTPMDAFLAFMCEPKQSKKSSGAVNSVLEAIEISQPKIVGVLNETDDIAHVVFRQTYEIEVPAVTESIPDLITCVRVKGEWRVLLPMTVWTDCQQILLSKMEELDKKDAAGTPKTESK